jgi:thiol-disulfide isomerase/thioredoxin
MQTVNTYDEANVFIENNELVFLYFSGENCAVCKALKPKVEELFQEYFPKVKLLEIPTDDALELTSKFGVFSLPTMALFIEQKEFLRKGRNVSLALLKDEVQRIYTLFLDKE